MKRIIFISLASILLVCGCTRVDELDHVDSSDIELGGIVTLTEDGKLSVTASIAASNMTDISVSTRASDDYETVINSGWCLVFGLGKYNYENSISDYSDDSPLLMKIPIQRNANGTFLMNFDCYEGVAFLRIVTNLTEREEATLEGIKAWGDDPDNYYDDETAVAGYTISYLEEFNYDADDINTYATFGQYKYQSVGLDGIYSLDEDYTTEVNTYELVTDANGVVSYSYYNINEELQLDPTKLSDNIPMSSIGFALDGIDAETLTSTFMTQIYMVRVCSKMDITVNDSGFVLSEVHMLGCAQEARLRSTVLTTEEDESGAYTTITGNAFGIPVDLGGAIDYLPLTQEVSYGGTTDPIYFYPNAGGAYSFNDGELNETINPQYVVIKGRASGYDTDGYYKIALKAQYPIKYDDTDDGTIGEVTDVSDLTYDILRNTSFKVELLNVDKPGYKTLADATDADNPASNISYNLTIISSDGRNETLISNGTYYVELNTTRIYSKGFSFEEGVEGKFVFTLYPNTSEDCQTPTVYVMSDFGVTIEGVEYTNSEGTTSSVIYNLTDDDIKEYYGGSTTVNEYWYEVPESKSTTEVTVTYSANASGRIRLRIGDMLKFVPLVYETDPKTWNGGSITIEDAVMDFAYDDGEDASTLVYYAYNSTSGDWDLDSDASWFENDGEVTANNVLYPRWVNALLYPYNANGITKLFLKQNGFGNPDAESDDNTIDFNDYYNDATGLHVSYYENVDDLPEDQVKYITEYFPEFTENMLDNGTFTTEVTINGNTVVGLPTYYLVAAKMMYLLETGEFTTIYFANEYHSMFMFEDGNIGLESVFDLVEEFVDYMVTLGEENGGFASDYTYALDLSEVTISAMRYCGEQYFGGNEYLKSIVLPIGVEYLYNNAFEGCTNLAYVRIGEEDTPSSFVAINDDDVFNGCTSLEQVIIYSYNNQVAYKDSYVITSSNSYGTSAFYGSSIDPTTYTITTHSTSTSTDDDGSSSSVSVYIHNWED